MVTDALRNIPRGDGPGRVLICGSLYLAGEVLKLDARVLICGSLYLAGEVLKPRRAWAERMARLAQSFCRAALLLATPAQAAWDSFEIIEWQPRNAAQLETLRKLGVTAVTVMADRDGTGTPLDQQTAAPREVGLRWYIENIATDFYASYHRYTPGRPVNWRFLAAQQRIAPIPTMPPHCSGSRRCWIRTGESAFATG